MAGYQTPVIHTGHTVWAPRIIRKQPAHEHLQAGNREPFTPSRCLARLCGVAPHVPGAS